MKLLKNIFLATALLTGAVQAESLLPAPEYNPDAAEINLSLTQARTAMEALCIQQKDKKGWVLRPTQQVKDITSSIHDIEILQMIRFGDNFLMLFGKYLPHDRYVSLQLFEHIIIALTITECKVYNWYIPRNMIEHCRTCCPEYIEGIEAHNARYLSGKNKKLNNII